MFLPVFAVFLWVFFLTFFRPSDTFVTHAFVNDVFKDFPRFDFNSPGESLITKMTALCQDPSKLTAHTLQPGMLDDSALALTSFAVMDMDCWHILSVERTNCASRDLDILCQVFCISRRLQVSRKSLQLMEVQCAASKALTLTSDFFRQSI